MGLVAQRHVESSWTRDPAIVSSIERRILHPWTIREARCEPFLKCFIEYCFCFMFWGFLAPRHVGFWLPDQGANPQPLLGKVKAESLDQQRRPCDRAPLTHPHLALMLPVLPAALFCGSVLSFLLLLLCTTSGDCLASCPLLATCGPSPASVSEGFQEIQPHPGAFAWSEAILIAEFNRKGSTEVWSTEV